MTTRHILDLRKTPEELEAEGIVDPGPFPLEGTTEEIWAWMNAHAKTMHDPTPEYHEAAQAAMAEGGG
jgi:hypothetical protein